MKIVMRGWRPTGQDNDEAEARARARLRAALLSRQGQDQQQQQREAAGALASTAAVAAAAAAQAGGQPAPSLLQRLAVSASLPGGLPSFASAATLPSIREAASVRLAQNQLQEQRLMALQQAQLESQLRVEAMAQARIRALLVGENESQAERELRLLQQQVRQPQRQQGADLLLGTRGLTPFAGPIGGATASIQGLAGNNTDALSIAAAAHASLSLGQQQQQQQQQALGQPHPSVASLMGAGGASRDRWNLSALPLQEESLAGKITRLGSNQVVPDLALQAQSQSRGQYETKEAKEDEGSETRRGYPQEGAYMDESEDTSTEDDMSDDEFFRTHINPKELQPSESSSGENFKRPREVFPLKLYRILHEAEQNGQADIVSFLPHGRAFAVHKSAEFIRDIMPKYFGAGRMNTFLKQLNLYNFRRITDGPDKGAYYHARFMRGKRHNCKKIKRKKTNLKAAPPSPEQAAAATRSQSPSGLTKLYEGKSELSSARADDLETQPPASIATASATGVARLSRGASSSSSSSSSSSEGEEETSQANRRLKSDPDAS